MTRFWRRAGRIAAAFGRSFRPELLATAAGGGVASLAFLARAAELSSAATGHWRPGWEHLATAAGNPGAEAGLFLIVWMLAQPYFRGLSFVTMYDDPPPPGRGGEPPLLP